QSRGGPHVGAFRHFPFPNVDQTWHRYHCGCCLTSGRVRSDLVHVNHSGETVRGHSLYCSCCCGRTLDRNVCHGRSLCHSYRCGGSPCCIGCGHSHRLQIQHLD